MIISCIDGFSKKKICKFYATIMLFDLTRIIAVLSFQNTLKYTLKENPRDISYLIANQGKKDYFAWENTQIMKNNILLSLKDNVTCILQSGDSNTTKSPALTMLHLFCAQV